MAYLLRCQEAARKAGIAMPEREEHVLRILSGKWQQAFGYLLRAPVIFHRRHATFLFEHFKEMVIAAESAELADITDRQPLQEVPLA